MPYCTNCGRKLNDGEVCGCRDAAQQQVQPQQPYEQQPWGYPQNGQPYPNPPYPYPYPYPYPQIKPVAYDGTPLPPPPKPSKMWLLAIIIPFGLFFIALLVLFFAVYMPSARSYSNKAKQRNINSVASGIRSAANDTLNELDIEEEWVMGDYIISSNNALNVYVGFDEEKFYKKEEFHFADLDKYEYFIVVENGKPVYAAVSESWHDKKAYIGTYPLEYDKNTYYYAPVKYSAKGEKVFVKDKETLNDLYEYARDEFEKKLDMKMYKEER